MGRIFPDRTFDRGAARWLLLAIALLSNAGTAHAQLRIVTYNTTGAPYTTVDMTAVLKSIGEETRNDFAKPIDVLFLQEQDNVSGLPDATAFVTLLNTAYTGQMNLGMPITYARGSLVGYGDTTQSVVYRTQTVDLLAEASVGVSNPGSPSAQPRANIRHHLRPDGYSATASEFYVYNGHFKAGDAADDPNNLVKRNTEATAVRGNADSLANSLGGNLHAIYVGDFNLYTAGEAAFQTLTADNGSSGRAFDPLGLTNFDNNASTFLNGEWHNNFASSFSHTQSPCASSAEGCGSSGGMDDRFDFQLITDDFDDEEGLSLIDNSYHAFGNGGGFCCNSDITTASNPVTFPGVTATKATVLAALKKVTDHIPVVADYQVPAILNAVADAVPQSLNFGEAFNLNVAVRNAALVMASIGADELDYSASATGDVLGSFVDQVDLADAFGMTQIANTHQFLFDTSTLGTKTGTITVESASQAVMNALVQIPVSYTVLSGLDGDYDNNGFVDALDYTVWRNHFGELDETALAFQGDGGDVGETDFELWKMHYGDALDFGAGGGSGGSSNRPVPEPAGGLILASLFGCCLASRRLGTLRAWNCAPQKDATLSYAT